MVPILAKQALARKCEFSNARMTGNYECAYALGVVSGALAIPKEENAANLVELKNKIEPQYKKLSSENEQIKKLILLLCDYEPSDIFDEQIHIDISSEGKNINAKSLMGIMAFGLRDGMSVTISAEGNDADKAVETIKKFLIGE